MQWVVVWLLIFYIPNDAGVKYALLLGGGSKLRRIQVASSENPWLFVGCWGWHENAGPVIAFNCFSLSLLPLPFSHLKQSQFWSCIIWVIANLQLCKYAANCFFFLLLQGYNGSQSWDTSFAVQAIISTNLAEEFGPALRKAHEYIKDSQVLGGLKSYCIT